MMRKLICTISRPVESYEIMVFPHLIKNLHLLRNDFANLGSRFAIVTDDQVFSLYGQHLHEAFLKLGLEAYLFSFPAGEHSKTRKTKEELENQLFQHQLGRDTCLIALGGGVVTDLTSYLASTYCRGVPVIMIPTSLLSMVDASIGGKTGVNVPWGKNMVGTIYPPSRVLIDSSFLLSLPPKELKNGFVEMLKHGLIADAAYFYFLEEHAKDLLNFDSVKLEQVIWESCRIKAAIVEEDEKDCGKRQLLNFGHTVGHALEKVTHYTLSHGEAVAIGILVESYLSLLSGYLNKDAFDRIEAVFKLYGMPSLASFKMDVDLILETMVLDKKSRNRQPHFVLLKEIGQPVVNQGYCLPVETDLIKQALEFALQHPCAYLIQVWN